MLFNSLQFLVFFLIVSAAYFALPHRRRWMLLFVASCYFYMVLVPEYILILFFLIIVDYSAGILIEKSSGAARKAIFVGSLCANIGMLALFKYFNFFDTNLHALGTFVGLNIPLSPLHLILPIGLSFHTFQSMSYTIEVYRGRYKAERHLGLYALYVLFYPQMVAGPIERPQHLLKQFHEAQEFDYQRVADGLKIMVWGLFKKVVIADRLAVFVSQVYDHPSLHSGFPLLAATYCFSIQIYCDFSGYSDMAIGAAKVMGIDLMQNFRQPYHATSIADFWRRWHISLSTWFRDYLYISLGGNRVGRYRWFFNLFMVFLISGLWHGANWTFVVWGALHGAYLIGSIVTEPFRERLCRALGLTKVPRFHRVLKVAITFHLVSFSWILFRAASLGDAWTIISRLFPLNLSEIHIPAADRLDIAVALLSVLVLEIVHLLQRERPILERLRMQPAWSRWTLYAAAVSCILLFGKFISLDFIYFQF